MIDPPLHTCMKMSLNMFRLQFEIIKLGDCVFKDVRPCCVVLHAMMPATKMDIEPRPEDHICRLVKV